MTATLAAGRDLRDALRALVIAHGVLDSASRPCGTPLPLPHAYALLELFAADRPLRVAELADRLEIDRTNVSRLCQRMEDAGELERATDERDARARALRLTTKGRALARHVERSSAAHHARLYARLGADAPRVLRALAKLQCAIEAERTSMSESA